MDNDEWIHPYIRKSERRQITRNTYEYSKTYDLINDPELMRAGVEARAVLNVGMGRLQGRIKFVRGNQIAQVTCMNVVVDQIVFDGEEEAGFRSVSTEFSPSLRYQLPPEEHYVALKSFVGYLVEEGMEAIDQLFEYFLQVRVSEEWDTQELPALKRWVESASE